MRRLSHCLLMGVVVGSLGLASCATVLHRGGPELVTITSEPPEANVTITNLWTRQRILQATTPVVASLARHAGYMRPARYEIVVQKPGYQLYVMILQAEVEKQYVGNVAVKGPLGFLVIDPFTGAMYALPSRLHAVLITADSTRAAGFPQDSLPLHTPVPHVTPPAAIR